MPDFPKTIRLLGRRCLAQDPHLYSADDSHTFGAIVHYQEANRGRVRASATVSVMHDGTQRWCGLLSLDTRSRNRPRSITLWDNLGAREGAFATPEALDKHMRSVLKHAAKGLTKAIEKMEKT